MNNDFAQRVTLCIIDALNESRTEEAQAAAFNADQFATSNPQIMRSVAQKDYFRQWFESHIDDIGFAVGGDGLCSTLMTMALDQADWVRIVEYFKQNKED